jgi:pyruvate-formate lyase
MLSLDDRIKSMRETKIRHTLEKKEQNGYTNLDDFGTVPLPEGYEVIPLYTSENGSFYGYEGMAENFCRVLDAHPAYVDPMEMLCGRWRDMLVNYRGDVHYMPNWMKKNAKLRDFISQGATEQWSKRWDEKRFSYDELKPWQKMYNISSGIDGDAHFACDYRIGFELGFGGFLDKIAKYRAINPDKEEFYAAEEKCVLAMIRFVDRHIDKIRALIAEETRPEIKASLISMLRNCENIRTGAPKTFAEACQWAAFFNCFSRVYTRDGAGFQLDTLLLPYYEKDVAKGRLDDDTARFLLANLLLIDPHYYQISGVDENDHDITNRLSYLVLEAADLINISCNITVRVHENCDPEFLRLAVKYLFKNKNGWPRFCCDRTLCEGYMKNGVDKATARARIAVGCNWMCVPGREFPMNDTVKINIAKVFEQAIITLRSEVENGAEPNLSLLYQHYLKHLEKAVEVTAAGVNLHLDHIADVTPELVMNLMFKGSLESGLDASQCAELYTIGCDGAGLAVVADSLAAIETRIEREKLITWDQLFKALDDNFADKRIHAIMKSAPKFCQGGTVADEWAKKLTDSFVNTLRNQKMPKGRMLVPGWFSWARTIEYGKEVGATPNGRRAGEPISHGANPNPGFRQDGAVTAMSNGIASVQPGYGNAAPLQLEFDPKIGIEEGGIEAVCSLILGHFAAGGTLININIIDTETLLEAHHDPSTHPDLVVRVTGFTAYFASLSPEFRQLVVDRFIEGF